MSKKTLKTLLENKIYMCFCVLVYFFSPYIYNDIACKGCKVLYKKCIFNTKKGVFNLATTTLHPLQPLATPCNLKKYYLSSFELSKNKSYL